MSWISWTSLVPTLLVSSASLAWWFTEPKNARINLIAGVGVVLFCWAVAPELSRDLSASLCAAAASAVSALHLELWLVRHANMLLTGAAIVWLARRAWQTLWKPVPELINILGVDVPDPPDVSLAGIRADAATINWTRPPANRTVQKFLIQVNGVVVGEVAANQEPAIVVSGLKPNHFYNVRVIAVGSNNFQAGSRFIRLRTFGTDGRPQLGNSRMPSNFSADEPGLASGDNLDESGNPRSSVPALETAAPPEGVASPSRDAGYSAPGPRRNTVTRRHSPSTTSIDQPTRDEVSAHSKKTLPELTERFESIRKETEDVLSIIAKEEADHRRSLEELEAEKREKKQEQKKKEELTEKLKRDVNSTDRTMRNALQRKAQREKQLKEKQNQRAKLHDSMAKWEKGLEDMGRDRECFDQQLQELEGERDQKVESFSVDNRELQAECSRLEAELKERREQVRELEEARKKLPGGEEDDEWREKETEMRSAWHRRHRELHDLHTAEGKRERSLIDQIRVLTMQLQHIPQQAYAMYNQPNASGLEFDNPALTHLKRRSRTGTSLPNVSISSPLPAYSQLDAAVVNMTAPAGFASTRSLNAPPGFAPGPFMMDISTAASSHRHDDGGFRGSSAPLSPSAAALLPSNILDDFDDDDPSPGLPGFDPFVPQHRASPDDAPLSPASSAKSLGLMSSPHGSSHHLPFPSFTADHPSDRMSLNATAALPSPIAAEAPPGKLGGFFSFQRSKTAKAAEKEPPLLGSLKSGQSQSFPRQTDDPDVLTNKRRISLSGTWNMFNRNSAGPDILEGHAPHARMFSTRTLNPFSSSSKGAGGLFPDRDPSSPRPTSIASSDFPRPSTDSGSIWGPPADPSGLGKPTSRLWSPEAPWSRNPSRRPSLHGSPSALKTTLASADDEILDDETVANVNQVGVIGSRPPGQSSKSLGRLNPNAPAFIGSLFKSKPDKEKEAKDKTKGKDKPKAKDRTKAKEAATTTDALLEAESPVDSRKSRDGISVHTMTSVSESRDSLTLDHSFSNTPSEPASAGLSGSFKDSENVVRKLFRKSSSSKFSLTGRLGNAKKGPSSVASVSDRGGASMERSSIGDFDDLAGDGEALNPAFLAMSYDSVTSSPSLGPVAGPTSSPSVPAGVIGAAASSGGSVKGKESKMPVRWLSNFGKKGKKEKDSLELERGSFDMCEGARMSEDGKN